MIVLVVLACLALCVATAWFQKSKPRFEVISLFVYSAVILLYIWLVLWFWLTGVRLAM